jgi:hypothetical protein
MITAEATQMEVIDDIVLGEFPEYLKRKRLRTPLTRHVRIVVHDLEELEEENLIKENRPKFSELSICGMWADNKEMEDPSAYVRKIREPRYKDAY